MLGEITRGRRRSDGDASGAALHRRVGRGARDVRALESVFRARRRRDARHGGVPLRAGRREDDAHHRARFRPAEEFRVKLEGAGKIGERYVGMVGIRDPYTIAHVDDVIGWARQQGARALRRFRLRTALHRLRPRRHHGRSRAAEAIGPRTSLCILVQGVAPTAAMAEEVCMIGTRQMFYARLPDVKGSAGSVAFALDEVLRASPAYRWTLNHTLRCDDPLELFPTHMTTAGRLKAMAAKTQKLSELAKTIRSKNAGVDLITFDIIFSDRATYERVKRARVLTRESVQRLYRTRARAHRRFRRVRSRQRDQVHDLSVAAERRSRRSGHLRRAAIRAAAGHRSSGAVIPVSVAGQNGDSVESGRR